MRQWHLGRVLADSFRLAGQWSPSPQVHNTQHSFLHQEQLHGNHGGHWPSMISSQCVCVCFLCSLGELFVWPVVNRKESSSANNILKAAPWQHEAPVDMIIMRTRTHAYTHSYIFNSFGLFSSRPVLLPAMFAYALLSFRLWWCSFKWNH